MQKVKRTINLLIFVFLWPSNSWPERKGIKIRKLNCTTPWSALFYPISWLNIVLFDVCVLCEGFLHWKWCKQEKKKISRTGTRLIMRPGNRWKKWLCRFRSLWAEDVWCWEGCSWCWLMNQWMFEKMTSSAAFSWSLFVKGFNTVGNNNQKFIFGSGTRLIIVASEYAEDHSFNLFNDKT